MTRLAALALLSVLASGACTDHAPTGPTDGLSAVFSLAPIFPAVESTTFDPASAVDRLHASFTSARTGVTRDTLVMWPLDQSTLEFTVEMPLSATQETFAFRLKARAGETPLFEVEGELRLTAGQTPSVEAPVLEYVGPGATAAGVSIGAAPDHLSAGDTVRLVAVAHDDSGEAIAGVPMATPLGPESTLNIVLGGTEPGNEAASHDQLVVDGNVTLDGTLNATFFGGFTPAAGDRFVILTFTGTRIGEFASENLPTGCAVDYSPAGSVDLVCP